MPELSERSF